VPSEEELEFQVNDGRWFEKFVGLRVIHSIPDAITVSLFREYLRQAGVHEDLFQIFDGYLDEQGLRKAWRTCSRSGKEVRSG